MLFIPQIALAVWWNPSTWLKSSDSEISSNTSDQRLLERISELEKKMNEKDNQLATSSVSAISAPEPDLQVKLDLLKKENVDLKSRLLITQKQFKSLQDSYNLCRTNSSIKNPDQEIIPQIKESLQVVQKDTPFAYDSYVVITMSDYLKSPATYLGWGTEIMNGVVNDFLGIGYRGGNNNYIEIRSTSNGGEKIMLQVDNINDYNKIVYSLNKGDIVNVYGVGFPSQKFKVGSSDTDTIYEPVLNLQRIDKCGMIGCNSEGNKANTTIFFKVK